MSRGTHSSTKKGLGLIGLGLMGTALTERLLEHGYHVTRAAG